VDRGIHFISGLPRSGSTLLAAILRQNPRFHAGMMSPVGSLFSALLREMSQANEAAVFIDDTQRAAILRALFDAYYLRIHPHKVVFDTNRVWCARLPALAALFPRARVIACVRDVPWILDSIERLVRRNRFEPSGIFKFDPSGTVYSRLEALGSGTGMVGFAWNALREACFGEHADRLILLTYETLTADPARALAAVYDFIGEPPFAHDFVHVSYDEAREFDARLGTPGLHEVAPVVRHVPRRSVLPPDLFARYEPDTFWRDPARVPPGLRVV
jgi:sulfotransferase